jgi:DNA-binding transcriptional ArsR family regulator
MQMSQMLNDTMTELVAKRFRALGEPMRLRILQAL